MVAPLPSMIALRRSTTVIYSLIMLCHLSRLNLFSCSLGPTFSIDSDSTDSRAALRKWSKSFSAPNLHSFTMFDLVNQEGKTLLYVVSKNDTIIEVDTEDMHQSREPIKPECKQANKNACDEEVTISHISHLPLGKGPAMYYCLYANISPYLTQCVVPNKLKWLKSGFASTTNLHRTFPVETEKYLFIGSFNKSQLVILRTKLPDNYGSVSDEMDLTSLRNSIFRKNSRFLEAFQTKYEVYYVVSETRIVKRRDFLESESQADSRMISTTWLIRICKDDPGSLGEHTRNFGTTAMAEIICPVGTGPEEHLYTRSTSASWAGGKLYVLFESERNSPEGKVVCVYDEFAFKSAFNGKVMEVTFEGNFPFQAALNPIEDVCKKITEGSLNNYETVIASQISVNGLYREKPVRPINDAPLIKLTDLRYSSLHAFKLHRKEHSAIIALIGGNLIGMVSHHEGSEVCHLKDLQLEEHERIYEVKGDYNYKKLTGHLYVSTNNRVLQVGLSMCGEFQDHNSCIGRGPHICGWDARLGRCTQLTEDTNEDTWVRSKCGRIQPEDDWSFPKGCSVNSEEESLACKCTYCLRGASCGPSQRLKVSNCQVPSNVDTYGPWSPWSECSPQARYQRRTRQCQITKCDRRTVDYRKCDDARTSVYSGWTKSQRSPDGFSWVRFRANCTTNPFVRPTVEEKTIPCGESCVDDSSNWSEWSECSSVSIQYRILKCSSFKGCPHSNTEVKACAHVTRKLTNPQGEKGGGYALIHIVLACLIVSLVWLIHLITLIVCLFKRCSGKRKRSSGRQKGHKVQGKGMPSLLYRPPYIQQKSILSETSNEYVFPNIHSPYNNLTESSLTSTILSDHTTTSIKSNLNTVPLINDNHPDTFDH